MPTSNGFNLHLRLANSVLLEAFDKILNYHFLHCSSTAVLIKGSSSEDKLQIIPEEQMSQAVFNEGDFLSRLFYHQCDRVVQYLFCWEFHLNIAWHLLPRVTYSSHCNFKGFKSEMWLYVQQQKRNSYTTPEETMWLIYANYLNKWFRSVGFHSRKNT